MIGRGIKIVQDLDHCSGVLIFTDTAAAATWAADAELPMFLLGVLGVGD